MLTMIRILGLVDKVWMTLCKMATGNVLGDNIQELKICCEVIHNTSTLACVAVQEAERNYWGVHDITFQPYSSGVPRLDGSRGKKKV